MSELKPCPFCGGEGMGPAGDSEYGWDCSCPTVDCPANHDTAHPSPDDAIAAWNRRASSGWISVEERPELGQPVVVLFRAMMPDSYCYAAGRFEDYIMEEDTWRVGDEWYLVRCWMPLSDPSEQP